MRTIRTLTGSLLCAAAVAIGNGCTESGDHLSPQFDAEVEALAVTFGGDEVIFFESEESKTLEARVTGAAKVDVEAPEGWTAGYADGGVTVKAPSAKGEASGVITVRATNAAGASREASQWVRLNATAPEVAFVDEGTLLLAPGETRTLALRTAHVVRTEAEAPFGWKASCEEGSVQVQAPASAAEGALRGEIVVTAYGRDDASSASARLAVVLQADPVRLDAGGTANCYIVSEAGYYSFDASVMGNGVYRFTADGQQFNILPSEEATDASLQPSGVKLLWQDSPDMIREVALVDGRIEVVVNHIRANALVAALDASGTVLWSWHLWGTPRPVEQPYPANDFDRSYTLLDRNLGAWASRPGEEGVCGLLYQWGRKDPFVGGAQAKQQGYESVPFSDDRSHPVYDIEGQRVRFESVGALESIGTMIYAIRNPMTYLYGPKVGDTGYLHWLWSSTAHLAWGNPTGYTGTTGIKVIYDPCPPGYRLPAADVWYDSDTFGDDDNAFLWDEVNGGRSINLGGMEVYYPSAGYRDYTEFRGYDYGEGRLWHVGYYGDYWSNSPSITRNNQTGTTHFQFSYYMRITKAYALPMTNEGYRASGSSVRCMKDTE